MTETMIKTKKPKAPKLFPDELIDQLLAQVQNKDAESILGESGLASQLKKQLAERMLAAELTHHLANEAHQDSTAGNGNHRNGSSKKTVITPAGELQLAIPRDRLATFEPQLIAKHQRRLPGFDDHVISMYARGMSVREIQGHLLELYGLQVSPDLISTITDEVIAEVEQWQQRPLEAMYPIVYFDALRLKIRDEGTVRNKAVYLALGIRADGRKEVLGLWIEQTESAKFWLKVFNELKNRGLNDILIAVVDGLRGFPEAIEAVYLQAQIQTCIAHLIRNSPQPGQLGRAQGAGQCLETGLPGCPCTSSRRRTGELCARRMGEYGRRLRPLFIAIAGEGKIMRINLQRSKIRNGL